MALKGTMTPQNMTPEELKQGAELFFKGKEGQPPLTLEQEKGFSVTMRVMEFQDRLNGHINDDKVYGKLETAAQTFVKLDELKEKFPNLEYKIANGGADNKAIIDTNIKIGNGTLQMEIVGDGAKKGVVNFLVKPDKPGQPTVKINSSPLNVQGPIFGPGKEALSTLEEYVNKYAAPAQKSQVTVKTEPSAPAKETSSPEQKPRTVVQDKPTGKPPTLESELKQLTGKSKPAIGGGRLAVLGGAVSTILGMAQGKDRKETTQNADVIDGMMGLAGIASHVLKEAISESKPETPKKEVNGLSEADKRAAADVAKQFKNFGIPEPINSDLVASQKTGSAKTQARQQPSGRS